MTDTNDYEIPKPEPKEIDEKNWLELQHFIERAVLRGEPYGEEKCGNCLYYLDTDASLTYCWHPQLRVLRRANLLVSQRSLRCCLFIKANVKQALNIIQLGRQRA